MKILFTVSAFNGLSQRAWLELDRQNHQVQVHIFSSEEKLRETVSVFQPELIIAPYLKKKIPSDIFKRYTCLVVHPGIVGDRGASAIDWAVLQNEKEWGVTIVQAVEKMDAGPVWAYEKFAMRSVSKAQLYRHEVTQAAVKALLKAVEKFEQGDFSEQSFQGITGKWNRATTQNDFSFDWKRSTDSIIRKINAADSSPGALAKVGDESFYLFGSHKESTLGGEPGKILAQRSKAICVATGDGAVWLSHLKRPEEASVKLPAALALGEQAITIPELPLSPFDTVEPETYREIAYEEHNEVGYIHFNFYNGAMNADQCRELQRTFLEGTRRNTKVIVLMGGADLWSNGIHLNCIEASENPAQTAWENIVALNDLIESIIRCETHYIISALQGNAGAGGVPLALAADKVIARKGIVLNPHTRNMGLYGSEYWTYLLPRRIGTERARQFTEQCLPWGTDVALEVKLIDECIEQSGETFVDAVERIAESVSQLSYFDKLMQGRAFKRKRDEAFKPLDVYREEELKRMRINFFEDDNGFDLKRHFFVHKIPMPETAGKLQHKDLFSERRRIWRRRKYEPIYYDAVKS
jgi:putative two-component system protein, hydrogenase maturation factor HypX/HoxX